ncbi:hypothetical protein Zmor_010577 [Zophobas morio]|uniref:Uncharacterized protein n=1 Tax=Zophobas morio TaxID=2755281 RepID=A0AA38IL74_9CUCU|nr:hypothetical protein Zmor_010577 [Zophobas morio]
MFGKEMGTAKIADASSHFPLSKKRNPIQREAITQTPAGTTNNQGRLSSFARCNFGTYKRNRAIIHIKHSNARNYYRCFVCLCDKANYYPL